MHKSKFPHTSLAAFGLLLGHSPILIILAISVSLMAGCSSANKPPERPAPVQEDGPVVTIPIPPSDVRRVPTYDQKFRLGQGYNTLDGSIKGMAVVASKSVPSPGDKGSHTIFTLQSASSQVELADKLSVSVSGGFSALGGGGSTSFNYAKSISSSKESLFILVVVDVSNSAEGLDSYVLEDSARTDANKLTRAQFFRKYGDRFISASVSGGSYRAVMELQNDSLAEKEDTKASLEGHMGSFSTAAEMNHEVSVITHNKHCKVSVLQNGGTRTISTTDLIAEAEHFPETVAPDKNPVALKLDLLPYSIVQDWPFKKDAPSVDVAFAELKYLSNQNLKLAALRESMQFAYENPELFDSVNAEQLKKEIDKTDSTFDKLNKDVVGIMNDPTTPARMTNYLAAYSEPAFKNPPAFPVKVTLYSRAMDPNTIRVTPTTNQDGNLVGTPGTWIQAIGLQFPVRTYGLSITYVGTFMATNGQSRVAGTHSGSDGDTIGVPPPGDIWALKSISVKLKGPRSRFYEVIYKGEMVGGTTHGTVVEKKNGEVLAADGQDFNAGMPISPQSWIQRISVEVRKK